MYTYLHHSQIPLHIIDLQQVYLFTLDPINLLTMDTFLPFVELLYIFIETLPALFLNFERIIQSFPKSRLKASQKAFTAIQKEND